MITLIVLIAILFVSFILAIRSMGDFEAPKEIKTWLSLKKIKGTIVFFKNRVKHYHH